MDQVLAVLKWGVCLCYVVDGIIMSDTFAAHIGRLRLGLGSLRAAKLTLKPSKYAFGYKEIKVLVSEKVVLPEH